MSRVPSELIQGARYVKRFGFSGAGLFWRTHVRRPARIRVRVPDLPHPFVLRGNQADILTFEQNFISNLWLWELCRQRLDPRSVRAVIDCGANIGITSIIFKQLFPGCRLAAVEPSPENFAMLQENLRPYEQVRLFHAGVWSRTTRLKVVDRYNIGYNGLVVEETTEKDAIPALSVEDVARQAGIEGIDILKIDIEGAERELFAGDCDRWIASTRALIVEVHDYAIPGSSRSFVKAIARHDFDIFIGGESLFCLNARPGR